MIKKDDINKHLKKLKDLEDVINRSESGDESADEEFLNQYGEIGDILEMLNKDVSESLIPKNYLEVKVNLLSSTSKSPVQSNENSNELDLFINEIKEKTDSKIVASFGISIDLPSGYVGLLFPSESVKSQDTISVNPISFIESGKEITITFEKTPQYIGLVPDPGLLAAYLLIIPSPKIKIVM